MAFVANMTETIRDGVLKYIENVRAGKFDVLDAFLLGWVAVTLVAVILSSWVTKIITKRRQAVLASGALSDGHVQRQKSIRSDGKPGETCDWVNSAVAWLYMHQSQTPDLINCWLKALNEQTKKQGSTVQVTFDRIKPGSLPPKVKDVKTEAGPADTLTVNCIVDTSNVVFVIFATQQTSASVKLSTCDVHVAKLAGQLRLQVQCKVACITEEIHVTAMFDGKPELKLTVKPQNAAMDDVVDMTIVEDIVRNAIMNCITTYTLSAKNLPKDVISSSSYQLSSSFQQMTKKTSSSFQTSPPNKPPRAHERRLLVKVIKANGLAGGNELNCGEPYCTIDMDTPVQKHKTGMVRNTANPFWDEHFLFDLSNETSVIKFTVLDRDKPPNDQFLGTAVVSLESLRRNPSTRQIIPLQGRTGQDPAVTGSITIEFLFMEPAEAQAVANQMNSQPSPLRAKYPGTPTKKVETERTITPTGTVITTVTTTTSRPKVQPERKIGGPSQNDVPSKVTKATMNDSQDQFVTPPRERHSPNQLAPPPLNDTGVSTSSQEHAMQRTRTPTKKSTLIIQGVSRSPVDELQAPSSSPTPSPTPSDSLRKSRGTSPVRSKRRFFSFGKKDKEKDKRRHSSQGDLNNDDKTRSLPHKPQDTLQVPGSKPGRSASAGDLGVNSKHENRSDTSSIRSTGSRGSLLSYTPNEYSTLVVETVENGRIKHYLIPASLAKVGKFEVRGTKLHVYNDHCFVATHFTSTISCEVCGKTLTRRMGKQGYQCRDCKIIVHKHCHFRTEAHCPNSRVSSMEIIKYSPPPRRRRSFSLGRGRSRSRSRDRRYEQEDSVVSEPSSDSKETPKSEGSPEGKPQDQKSPLMTASDMEFHPTYTVESAPPQSLPSELSPSGRQIYSAETHYFSTLDESVNDATNGSGPKDHQYHAMISDLGENVDHTTKDNSSPVMESPSPILDDLNPFLDDTSPFRDDTSPFRDDTSPFRDDTSPFRDDTSPFRDNASPTNGEPCPIHTSPSPIGSEFDDYILASSHSEQPQNIH